MVCQLLVMAGREFVRGLHSKRRLGGFAQSGHIVDEAKAHYEVVLEAFKFKLEALHKDATKLETQKHVVMGGSFQRFIELFERQKQRMKISEKDFEINLNLTPTEVSQFEQVRFESLDLVKGTAQAVAASAAVGTGAVAFATTMGTAATTGTALSTLSGAAATNAMLAWFGGGAISAGGGGMAVGSMVLGGIFVAPAVGIAALIATSKGHEALTKAHKYEAQVAVACEQLEVKTTTVQGLQARVAEVSSVITGLDQRLLTQLRICEALERNSHEVGDDEKKEFFKAGSLATTLSKVLSAPIFDEELFDNAALPEIVANAKQTMQVDGPGAQV